MSDRVFDERDLPRAAVGVGASLEDAALELYRHGAGAVAVVADDGRVEGMLTEDDMLAAIFPQYLRELTHTAFVKDDELLVRHLADAATSSVATFVRKPETVELPTSALDVAQRFLHTDSTALIAVRDGVFAGVIDQTQFCRAILQRHGWRL